MQNGGVIINQTSGTISSMVAIRGAAGVVLNAGTINGDGSAAVTFGGNYANRVVVDPGAVFVGGVDGGGALSTLELASGTSVGMITNLVGQFTNFGTIAFDPGAHWSLLSDPAGISGLITGFAQGDTIQIAGLTASSSAFSNGC